MKNYFNCYKFVNEIGITKTVVVVTNFIVKRRWVIARWLESQCTASVYPITHAELVRFNYSELPNSYHVLPKEEYKELVKQNDEQTE